MAEHTGSCHSHHKFREFLLGDPYHMVLCAPVGCTVLHLSVVSPQPSNSANKPAGVSRLIVAEVTRACDIAAVNAVEPIAADAEAK